MNENVYFNLVLVLYFREGVKTQFTVSPSMPVYYSYKFPPSIKSVFIEIQSKDDLCTSVSVQSFYCPVYDVNEIGVKQGHYQTMSKSASFNVYVRDLIELKKISVLFWFVLVK